MPDKRQCEKMVPGEGHWGVLHKHQCPRDAKVEREGIWYCTIHDPVRREERNRKSQEKWDAESKARQEAGRRRKAEEHYCEGIDTEYLETHRGK